MPLATDDSTRIATTADGQSGSLASRSQLSSPESPISVVAPEITTGVIAANLAKPRVIPEIDEVRRRALLEPRRQRWLARAKSFATASRPLGHEIGCACEPCRPYRQWRYAMSRAVSIERKLGPRLLACGVEKIPIACLCHRSEVPIRCKQWILCSECQRARAAERKARIREGLNAALEQEIREWGERGATGQRPGIFLITVSHRHTGDLEADRAAIGLGWRKLYRAMAPKFGRFPYVGTWEITPGRCVTCKGYQDGDRERCACDRPKPEGHVHFHVAVIWRFRPWAKIRAMWTRACPSSTQFDIKGRKDDRRARSANDAAKYIAKYISKGVQGDAFTPELRADVAAAWYNAHAFSTSVRFWLPRDRTCRKCHVTIHRVIALPPEIYDRIEPPERYYVTRKFDPLSDDSPGHVLALYPQARRIELQDNEPS